MRTRTAVASGSTNRQHHGTRKPNRPGRTRNAWGTLALDRQRCHSVTL